MTAQAPERILINGDTQGLSEWPLETYIGLGVNFPNSTIFGPPHIAVVMSAHGRSSTSVSI